MAAADDDFGLIDVLLYLAGTAVVAAALIFGVLIWLAMMNVHDREHDDDGR